MNAIHLGTTLEYLNFLLSGDRDSNPGKVGLQPTAVTTVPSPRMNKKEIFYLKVFIEVRY